VLAACAVFDNRKVVGDQGEQLAEAWFTVLGDLDLIDCLEAVRRHYRDKTEWIMPADIRRGVRAIREERRREQPHEARQLPSRFEWDATRAITAERGSGTAREALAQLLEGLAKKSGSPAAQRAIDELRAITPGPSWAADEDEEGTARA
jgi:hypothetical protein